MLSSGILYMLQKVFGEMSCFMRNICLTVCYGFNTFKYLSSGYIGATHNWKVSTNKYGRWFKQYLETVIWQKVEKTFAGASIDDNWHALCEMIELTGLLCHTICTKLNFTYQVEVERNVIAYIIKIKSLEKH
jgi:aminoglycoside 6-adenylyltransferase